MFGFASRRLSLMGASGAAIVTLMLAAASPAAAAPNVQSRCAALAGLRVTAGRIETAEHVMPGARLPSTRYLSGTWPGPKLPEISRCQASKSPSIGGVKLGRPAGRMKVQSVSAGAS